MALFWINKTINYFIIWPSFWPIPALPPVLVAVLSVVAVPVRVRPSGLPHRLPLPALRCSQLNLALCAGNSDAHETANDDDHHQQNGGDQADQHPETQAGGHVLVEQVVLLVGLINHWCTVKSGGEGYEVIRSMEKKKVINDRWTTWIGKELKSLQSDRYEKKSDH